MLAYSAAVCKRRSIKAVIVRSYSSLKLFAFVCIRSAYASVVKYYIRHVWCISDHVEYGKYYCSRVSLFIVIWIDFGSIDRQVINSYTPSCLFCKKWTS